MYQFNNRYRKLEKHPLSSENWMSDMKTNRFSIAETGATQDPGNTRQKAFTMQLNTKGFQFSDPYYNFNA